MAAAAAAAAFRAPFERRTCWSSEALRHLPDRVELELRAWYLAPRCNDDEGEGGLTSGGVVTAVAHLARPDELHVDVDGELVMRARVLVCAEAGAALVCGVTGGWRGRRWRGAPRPDLNTLRWDARMKVRGRVPTPFRDLSPLDDLLECVRLVYEVDAVALYTQKALRRLRAAHAARCADALAALSPALGHASVRAAVAARMRPAWWDA